MKRQKFKGRLKNYFHQPKKEIERLIQEGHIMRYIQGASSISEMIT